jgi:hypothetical protein
MGAEIGQVFGEARQSLFRSRQRRFFLAEGKANLGRAVGGIAVETRARNDGDSYFFD